MLCRLMECPGRTKAFPLGSLGHFCGYAHKICQEDKGYFDMGKHLDLLCGMRYCPSDEIGIDIAASRFSLALGRIWQLKPVGK